jgi:hypothetical protein
MPIAAIWAVLSKLPWKYIGIFLAALSLTLLVWRAPWAEHRQKAKDAAVITALQGTITNMKAASATAKANNVAHVETVETKQDQVTKDHENDYPQLLADARSALATYKRLHPATAQGDAGRNSVSQVPDTTGKPDAADPQAVVSGADLDACAKDYVIAVGLQAWIRDQSAIAR